MGCTQSTRVLKESPTAGMQTDEYFCKFGEGESWVCGVKEERKITAAQTGMASEESVPFETIPKLFEKAAKAKGDCIALRIERSHQGMPPESGKDSNVRWHSWTWQQYFKECTSIAKAFMAFGLNEKDGVCIFGFNSPEWFMALLSGIMAGGVATGVYPTDEVEQVRFKARHSGAVIAVCQEAKQIEIFKKLSEKGDLPKLRTIVYWTPGVEILNFQNSAGKVVEVVPWSRLVEVSRRTSESEYYSRQLTITPFGACALIYTSGTTGDPKAVMISHDNFHFESTLVRDMADSTIKTHRLISYLPLSHVAGMLVDIIAPIICTTSTSHVEMSFARQTDLKEFTLKDRIAAVQPTMFLGVPRVWEKIQAAIIAKAVARPMTGCKKAIVNTAKSKGEAYANSQQMGGSGVSPSCYGCGLYQKVYKGVRAALGLTHCQFCVTAAAPIHIDTLQFFGRLGIQINEIYGMSETTGAATLSSPEAHIWGSCGYAAPGVEVAVFREEPEGSKNFSRVNPCPPDDLLSHNLSESYQGEICFRGRNIMMGYMANPELGEEHINTVKTKNRETIDENGWLHSGDKGAMDTRGMFKITGRYKELIITAGGENIAPVPIEDAIKDKLKGSLSNVIMIGDKRKFNSCLVTLNVVGCTGELPGGDTLAGAAADMTKATTVPEAQDDELWITKITTAITQVNKDGSVCPSNASRVQKFSILPADFSISTGELTPTLKLRRSIVEKKYASLIDLIYSDDNVNNTYVKCPGS
eukprot:TRINITY_DN12908_c1_g1_i1.p1 TRINITY_DN12908_c1_g1~~TRINITY_DN12908_c1_g1_i1.p1  ORF type:complete len:754 (+),score=131.99 TRINITY_DN12908_c1_g1_i1:104-2365(+)